MNSARYALKCLSILSLSSMIAGCTLMSREATELSPPFGNRLLFQFDQGDLQNISGEAARQCAPRGMTAEIDGEPRCGVAYRLLASGPVLQHCVASFVCK